MRKKLQNTADEPGTPYALFELDLIGDPLFTIGVPATAPGEFKRMVFAAAKTYVMGNSSVDYMLRQYGHLWDFGVGPVDEFKSLYLEICRFVTNSVDEEIQRFTALRKLEDHIGLFAAGTAFLRLQTSFLSACLLLRQHYWLELSCILKLMLEQIAWSYAIRHSEPQTLFATSPTKAVTAFRNFYPTAGQLYGVLNEMSHISPRRTIDYLDFSQEEPQVYLASAQQSARNAYFLLLLVDMYIATSEFIFSDHYQKRHATELDLAGGSVLKAKLKILPAIERFRRRLNRLQKKHYRPKFKNLPAE